ncbi:MAG: hypothetical protein SOY28_05605 [Roseburia sp.]|nr:hypothetical protein [Roseburia sp.]
MPKLPEANRLLAGGFDYDGFDRAKPVNERAEGSRMVHSGMHEWCTAKCMNGVLRSV